jgi:DNA-binding CsgD family transcriptional regulator
MHARGRRRTERGGGTLPSFERYWTGTARTSHEDRVTERIALHQIIPLLTSRQTEVVHALAATDNYRAAAELLDMNPRTFNVTIRHARQRFLAAWHQGETPSRTWGNDRRVGNYSTTEAPKTERRPATRNLHRRMAGGA